MLDTPLGPLRAALIALGILSAAHTANAEAVIVPAFSDAAVKGPAQTPGIVIWCHGRSLTREDSTAPTPLYLKQFLSAGWDVVRFNRPRVEDQLPDSTAALVAKVHALKAQGYAKIVVAGQSYGGFIALGAADADPEIHAVIATAPAAYGSFFDSYESWQQNGSALFQLLDSLQHTRVLLAFFHGDDYDPGGRGIESERILERKGLPFWVLDQPRDMVGHLAANSGLFVQRYGTCVVNFVTAAADAPAPPCDDELDAPSASLADKPIAEPRKTGNTGG
jgi:pimeloyl-ACP methyl ester carboxylesterase